MMKTFLKWSPLVVGAAAALTLSAMAGAQNNAAMDAPGVPTGPAIILSAGVLYLVSIFIGSAGGVVWRLLPVSRHRAA